MTTVIWNVIRAAFKWWTRLRSTLIRIDKSSSSSSSTANKDCNWEFVWSTIVCKQRIMTPLWRIDTIQYINNRRMWFQNWEMKSKLREKKKATRHTRSPDVRVREKTHCGHHTSFACLRNSSSNSNHIDTPILADEQLSHNLVRVATRTARWNRHVRASHLSASPTRSMKTTKRHWLQTAVAVQRARLRQTRLAPSIDSATQIRIWYSILSIKLLHSAHSIRHRATDTNAVALSQSIQIVCFQVRLWNQQTTWKTFRIKPKRKHKTQNTCTFAPASWWCDNSNASASIFAAPFSWRRRYATSVVTLVEGERANKCLIGSIKRRKRFCCRRHLRSNENQTDERITRSISTLR